MRLIPIGVLAVLLVPRALGQEKTIKIAHGTVLAYEQTASQAIVVVDSRVITRLKGKSQEACKIVDLSLDTVFFYSGNLFQGLDTRSGKEVFSQQKIAAEAYAHYITNPRSVQRLIEIANKYVEFVVPKMRDLFKKMSRVDAARSIGLAGFAGLDEVGNPRVIQINIDITVPNDGVSPVRLGQANVSEPPSGSVMISDPSKPPYREVDEFLRAQTPRAKKAMDSYKIRASNVPQLDLEAYKLIAAVQASLDWDKDDPYIGPPINALVIESSTGIRWIRGRERCARH